MTEKAFSLRMRKNFFEKLEAIKEETGISINNLILMALYDHFGQGIDNIEFGIKLAKQRLRNS